MAFRIGARLVERVAGWLKPAPKPHVMTTSAEFVDAHTMMARRAFGKIALGTFAMWALNDNIVVPATTEDRPTDESLRRQIQQMPCTDVAPAQKEIHNMVDQQSTLAICVGIPLIEGMMFRLLPLAVFSRMAPGNVHPLEIVGLGRGPTGRWFLGIAASLVNDVLMRTEESALAQQLKGVFLWGVMRKYSLVGSIAGHSAYNFCRLLSNEHLRELAFTELDARAAACFKK